MALAYAQQLATVQTASSSVADEGKSKPTVSVQVTRPPLPCDKPLPLANVVEVQRLLYLLEAPEYCMRAFREHGVNGQDLLHMQDEDLDDSRFKFPRHVQRKVLRVAEAWRCFQSLSGGPTKTSLSLEHFLDHHRATGCSSEMLAQLQSAFCALDVNDNGHIGFEEFLVGFTLMEAACVGKAAAQRGPAAPVPESAASFPTSSSAASSGLIAPRGTSSSTSSSVSSSVSSSISSQHILASTISVAEAAKAAGSSAPVLTSPPAALAAFTAAGGNLVRSLVASWLRA